MSPAFTESVVEDAALAGLEALVPQRGVVVRGVAHLGPGQARGNGLHDRRVRRPAAEAVAISMALVAGWLGGELVDRLGVGVDEGANLSAPNSLSGRPASAGRV